MYRKIIEKWVKSGLSFRKCSQHLVFPLLAQKVAFVTNSLKVGKKKLFILKELFSGFAQGGKQVCHHLNSSKFYLQQPHHKEEKEAEEKLNNWNVINLICWKLSLAKKIVNTRRLS